MIRSRYISALAVASLLGASHAALAQDSATRSATQTPKMSSEHSTHRSGVKAPAATTNAAKPLCSELNHPNAGKHADKSTGMAKERSSSPVHMDCVADGAGSAAGTTGSTGSTAGTTSGTTSGTGTTSGATSGSAVQGSASGSTTSIQGSASGGTSRTPLSNNTLNVNPNVGVGAAPSSGRASGGTANVNPNVGIGANVGIANSDLNVGANVSPGVSWGASTGSASQTVNSGVSANQTSTDVNSSSTMGQTTSTDQSTTSTR